MPKKFIVAGIAALLLCAPALALKDSREEMRLPDAVAEFGVTGDGVTIAVLDRGITWDHPDFLRPNGKTRIRAMLDQTGQNFCSPENPEPVEYTEQQINDALAGGPALAMRDAVGHGTATAGTAAGNGRALPDRRYQGIAPEADLIIVKMTSEGAVAHDGQPAEPGFNGCIDDAIEWAAQKMNELGQPAVLIINSGVQWGPMDGTSAVSRKLTEVFPLDMPGRVVVIPSGDEGSLPNHGGADFSEAAVTRIGIAKATAANGVMTAWYSGETPAEVTVNFDDGTSVGPVAPGGVLTEDGITIVHYRPGREFYPWTSTSGDRAVWVGISGHVTTGSFEIIAQSPGEGYVDLYGDVLGFNITPIVSVTDHLVPGRLQDYAGTTSAVVSANYIIRTTYVDLDGIERSILDEGVPLGLWRKSSGGPTRDGRDYGVDAAAPGQNMFAPVGPDSFWGSSRGNQPEDGEGLYIRFGGTSGSAPLTVGTVALMLQANPGLTARQVRNILRSTSREDEFTGTVPNTDWGWGKIDIYQAVRAALAYNFSGSWFNPDQSGHGWFVEVLQDENGARRLIVYWYVYLDGNPVWILATGPLVGTSATLDAFISSNGEFPPDFDGADVVPWGTLGMEFDVDGTAEITWTTEFDGFTSGSMTALQLSQITGTSEACLSGSFYNAAQSGHGLVVQFVNLGGDPYVLVTWYVYLDGEQVWLLGIAPFDGNPVDIPLDSWSGADFPPNFVSDDAVSTPWGTLTLDFTSGDTISASWTTLQEGYSDGGLDVIRLSTLGGRACLD